MQGVQGVWEMKKVYLIHGWDGSPEEPMLQWIKNKLEERNFKVIVPKMPNPSEPKINSWINKIRKVAGDLSEEDILIGHSVGCQAVLRYMETLKDKKVAKVILIAPWMYLDENTIKEEGEEVKKIAKPWVETPIDWKKVKIHCKEFIAIFSDNDPYVPLSNTNLFKEKLNAKILILNNKGHFDPSSGIKELPEILEFIK
jgi:predicted alpha/beta hydrolase family esterase